MKFIKLTLRTGQKFSLNAEMIGAIIEREDTTPQKTKLKYTNVKHLTHNNGGFDVAESEEQILKLIANLKS